jgi:hypothetical protein
MEAPFVCRRSLQIVEEFSMQQDAFKYKGKHLAELYLQGNNAQGVGSPKSKHPPDAELRSWNSPTLT